MNYLANQGQNVTVQLVAIAYAKHQKNLSIWGGIAHVGLVAGAFWDAFKAARFSKPLVALAALICIPLFTVMQIAQAWVINPVLEIALMTVNAVCLAVGELVTLPIRTLDAYRSWAHKKDEEALPSHADNAPFAELGARVESDVPANHEHFQTPAGSIVKGQSPVQPTTTSTMSLD